MRKKIFSTVIATMIAIILFAQQLPLNTCGIVNIYDAVGNRTKRVYFCNNGIDPYPTKAQKQEPIETMEFQIVDALYPNPTTGKFAIEFSRNLQNADVSILDITGKIITQFKASGYKVIFDLSAVASGVYFVRIRDGKNVISKKVLKQ